MLWCSGLWTNWPTARPAKGTLPYCPLVMNTTCAPSQVMREGNDLNQHGQAARHEQASSSSPVTFHGVLSAAMARWVLQRMAAERIDVIMVESFMAYLSLSSLAYCSGK